ncbi:hypothetical protein QBC46DRAFT_363720 [Diplogelasinospora grovesii]|uniref:Tc1-like transposase DDE domain-containing protein n=1 Tax=Diplogelasinospora grovesii TaxID=303347 RepID=A0AAN6N853_9PEZI|nr:hypothetical protein QBC46DRAFT_363720 [Diplogelasinospora grovesii]
MAYTHHDTPKKAMVRGTISFLEAERINHFKSRVFRHFGVPYASGYRALQAANSRRHHDDPEIDKQRGRKPILTDSLLHAARINKTWTLNYRKCITCLKSWRVEYATIMLARYPNKIHWYHIRFSNEAAIGHNFKSDLVFYNVLGNTNGKMSLKVYRDQILEKGPEAFILEEDNDSGHGIGKKNIIKDWKTAHNLKSYFNCSQSPDFLPIENAWNTLQSLAIKGWNRLSQDTINRWVDEMPQRLQDCIKNEGRMTGG